MQMTFQLKQERLQRSSVQLSERLASLGITGFNWGAAWKPSNVATLYGIDMGPIRALYGGAQASRTADVNVPSGCQPCLLPAFPGSGLARCRHGLPKTYFGCKHNRRPSSACIISDTYIYRWPLKLHELCSCNSAVVFTSEAPVRCRKYV